VEVERSPISGNLDAPEGGFDAIMQAIACRVSEYVLSYLLYLRFLMSLSYFVVELKSSLKRPDPICCTHHIHKCAAFCWTGQIWSNSGRIAQFEL